MTQRDQVVAIGAAGLYGWLGVEAQTNPEGGLAKLLDKVPGQTLPVGRAGVVAGILYALGRWGKIAPRYTIPAALGVGCFAATKMGQRKLAAAPQDHLGAGADEPLVLAGDFDESDFDVGGDYDFDVAGDEEDAELLQQ